MGFWYQKTKGFSLVELMVAITISLVLLAGLIQVFISTKRSYLIQDSLARMQENGRYAVELFTTDLRLAGYLGGNADITTITGPQAPVIPDGTCAGSNDGQWGRMIARSVFGINDALVGYNCIQAADNSPDVGNYLSGDVLTVRYSRPTNLTAAQSAGTRGYYIKSSPMAGQIALVNSTNGAIDNFFTPLTNVAGIPDTPVSYNQLQAHAYYSGHQTADCNGNGIQVPTLYRLALGVNGTPQQQELVRGVENLQVQYGIDTNNSGSPNRYSNANTITDWTTVQSVRIWLLVRDECPSSGFQNTNTYVMGDNNFIANDNFRRQLYTTTVMLRNN